MMSSLLLGIRGNHSALPKRDIHQGSRRSSLDCHAENKRAVGCLTTPNTNQSCSGEIVASRLFVRSFAIGVFCHRLRRWIVIVRESSLARDRWNRSRLSCCTSATSHLRLVHAASLTLTYIACHRGMTYVDDGC